jgi:choline-glycine betaine transporter
MMQDSTAVATTAQYMVNEGLERLDQLAAKLNIAVEGLWDVLVNQATIEAMQDVLLFLCSIAVIGVCYLFFNRMMKVRVRAVKEKNEEKEEFFFAMSMIAAFLGIAAVIWSIVNLIALANIPTKLFNPEYWALSEVLKLIQ